MLQPGEPAQAEGDLVEKQTRRRWRAYTYEELLQRDKVSLDLFWLRDESLEDSANLPSPT